MNRRLELFSIVLFALNAGVVGGGVTSSLADELTGVEVGVGELRGEILSLFARRGAVATETNPNYKGAVLARRDRLGDSPPTSSWTALTWASGSFLAPPKTRRCGMK